MAVCSDRLQTCLKKRLIQNFEGIEFYLERKALAYCCKGNDNLALTAEFGHHAINPRKNAVTHSHPCSHADAWMRPQEQSARQSFTNLVEFLTTYHASCFFAQQAKHAGGRDDRESVLRQETSKHIPRKERPLRDDGSVGPLYTLGVERQIVLHRTHNKVLRHSLFMVRNHMENMPQTAMHWSLLG
jgi:hypothetical protein